MLLWADDIHNASMASLTKASCMQSWSRLSSSPSSSTSSSTTSRGNVLVNVAECVSEKTCRGTVDAIPRMQASESTSKRLALQRQPAKN